jgi:MarR family 2-MHQ and catechol resistance regulon transcriptional repressor
MIHDQTAASPLKDEDTAAALRLWVVMNRAYRAIGERARRQVEQQELRPTEFGVLEALYHKGPLTLGQIGESVLVTSGSGARSSSGASPPRTAACATRS